MNATTQHLRRALPKLALVAALLAVGGVAWQHYSRPTPLEVSVAEVGWGRVEATVANTRAGTIKPCRRAKLSPQGGGQIARLMVREGDRVKAGQILMELWNQDLSAQLRLAEEQVLTARAHRDEACAAAAAARRESDRQRRLAAQGFVSAAVVDRAESDEQVRAAGCQAAETDIGAARARVETARAGLSRTVLSAPFAGIVAEVTGEQGEYSTPSPPGIPTPPAIDLIDDACLFVSAPVDEVDAPRIKVGQVARVSLDAFPGRHYPARVKRIAPYVLEVEKQARTVEVEVQFDTPREAAGLLVGFSADAEIILDTRDKVLRLPTQAVMEGGTALVLREGRLQTRKLETGLANWEYTEVVKGLAAGDQVVTSLSQEGVKAGAAAVAKAQP